MLFFPHAFVFAEGRKFKWQLVLSFSKFDTKCFKEKRTYAFLAIIGIVFFRNILFLLRIYLFFLPKKSHGNRFHCNDSHPKKISNPRGKFFFTNIKERSRVSRAAWSASQPGSSYHLQIIVEKFNSSNSLPCPGRAGIFFRLLLILVVHWIRKLHLSSRRNFFSDPKKKLLELCKRVEVLKRRLIRCFSFLLSHFLTWPQYKYKLEIEQIEKALAVRTFS